MRSAISLVLIPVALCFSVPAFAAKAPKVAKTAEPAIPVEIELQHQFGEAATAELQKVIDRFNADSKAGRITLAHASVGSKPAVLNILPRTAVAQAAANKQAFRPLFTVMAEAKEKFSDSEIAPDLRAGVTDQRGRFVALPLAYSTPVLFYNKAAFRKAGLDPDSPPLTWDEVQRASFKLLTAGAKCAYTTSWPVWIHIDNVSALSGVPVATPKGDLAFNAFPQVKHVAKLASWIKSGYFTSFGRRNEADQHFKEGECAMITTDAWAHTDFRDARGVELGVAPMPYYDDNYGGRQHTLADGPSLWIGGGYKPADYKLAARFISFLSAKEMQVQLARMYGHLPLTLAARTAVKAEAQRDRSQTLEVAYASMNGSGATHPLRISTIEPVRIILDEELEAVWADKQTAKGALDAAVIRGNAVLNAKPALKKALPF
ncbi:MAG TPA: extracellular solute-binding protein [Rhodocyclaceae bacterium]|nr:extracellular solute-binding protein [Rhodocyclaceae bacterium]